MRAHASNRFLRPSRRRADKDQAQHFGWVSQRYVERHPAAHRVTGPERRAGDKLSEQVSGLPQPGDYRRRAPMPRSVGQEEPELGSRRVRRFDYRAPRPARLGEPVEEHDRWGLVGCGTGHGRNFGPPQGGI